jgi:Luciferase-like monooxygenase
MRPLAFGTFIPQGWKSEFVNIPGPQQQWQTTVDTAVLADELGFDSVGAYDQRTSRVLVGQRVSCNAYRHPAVVAKIISTIDVIRGGRLESGIGAGWHEHDYKGYGFNSADFPDTETLHLFAKVMKHFR